MKKRIWMAGLAIALLMLVAQVYADGGRAEPPGGLLERLGAGIASLQQRIEEWRRAPYEKIEREFDTRHSALQHRLRTLEAQLDLQRMELRNVELTPGPMGPMGPQGPAGPRGRQAACCKGCSRN